MRKKSKGPSSGVLIKAAMDYGRLGWSVVPLQPNNNEPLVRWQVYQHRRPATTEIGDWFTRWPDANLAVVTGVVSALVVLDLNPRQDGEASLARLARENGPVPETVEAQSGGGRHLYFAHPGGIVPDRLDLAPGIDLRGDGGYLVAPPSVHASGANYRWVRSPDVFHMESLPGWLLGVAAGEHERPVEHLQRISGEEIVRGEAGDAVASLAKYLMDKGVDPSISLELILCWNTVRSRPPLEDEVIARIVECHASVQRKGAESDA